ncbi:MAG: hypothetical protein ABH851_04570 [Methanobacteriota archaeon]
MKAKGFLKTFQLILSTRLPIIILFLILSYSTFKALDGYAIRNHLTVIPLLFLIQIFLNDYLMIYLSNEMELTRRWFSLVIAPGTILHEMSHLISAVFTGCYITEVQLFKHNPRTGLLGFVGYTQPKDKWIVLRNLIIGFSPFIGCGLIVLTLNYFITQGEMPDLSIIDVSSFTEIYYTLANLSIEYLGKIFFTVLPQPILWIPLYLQFCFAIGSAPSTKDIKIFFHSLFKHPVSAIFFAILAYCMIIISESTVNVFGFEVQEIALLTLSAIILILSYSITVLLCSIPFVLVFEGFLKLGLIQRFTAVILSLIIYLTVLILSDSVHKSVGAAILLFLMLIVGLKNKKAFFIK